MEKTPQKLLGPSPSGPLKPSFYRRPLFRLGAMEIEHFRLQTTNA